MDLTVIYYAIGALLIAIGFAGTILPALPGTPLVFAGMWLAAWAGHYQLISGWTVIALAVLGALAMALDFLASTLGAKRVGASSLALWGALIGTVVGIFFGIPGLLLGPFIGAVIGQLLSGGGIQRSAHVGIGTWIGLLFGTLAKLALSFTMLGIFIFALIIP